MTTSTTNRDSGLDAVPSGAGVRRFHVVQRGTLPSTDQILPFLVLFLLLPVILAPQLECRASEGPDLGRAYHELHRGKISTARREFERLAQLYVADKQPEQWAEAMVGWAQACVADGSGCSAVDLLLSALGHVDPNSAPSFRIQLTLGRVYEELGKLKEAEAALVEAERLGKLLESAPSRAEAALELGTLAVLRRIQEQGTFIVLPGEAQRRGLVVSVNGLQQPLDGLDETFRGLHDAIAFSQHAARADLEAISLLRLAHFQTLIEHPTRARAILRQAKDVLTKGHFGSRSAWLWLTCGLNELALLRVAESTELSDDPTESLTKAASAAATVDDLNTLSFARGLQGRVLEFRKSYAEAGRATGEALFLAQRSGNQRALFEWQWQAGRILQAQGQDASAREFYRMATDTFRRSRGSFRAGQRGLLDYQSNPGDAFFELSNLNFRLADGANSPELAAAYLKQARDAVESYKAFEVESQFLSAECSSLLENMSGNIEQVLETGGKDAAIVYVLPLTDRTEILVTLPGQRQERRTIRKSRGEMDALAGTLRLGLATGPGKREGTEEAAQALHRELIGPIASVLESSGVKQLVFVLDGALARIPMAVLHDGSGFLIEKYAVANSPGLSLMEPGRLRERKPTMLIAGLTTKERNFAQLKHVGEEVAAIGNVFRNVTLLGEDFTGPNLKESILKQPFSMVHLASHAQFGGTAESTFVVVHGERLNLNELGELVRPTLLREKPIELLAFSACESARGNDRMELGLAGVALKSGARSVLATLWSVDDQSTARLMAEFYRELGTNPDATKGQALRAAQLALMKDPRFSHPYFWGPVVLVGNWL